MLQLDAVQQYLHLSVGVAGGDHLWEVDNDGFPLFRDHDVELVEVTVNDSVVSQPHNEVHEVVVQTFHIFHLTDATTRTYTVANNFQKEELVFKFANLNCANLHWC